MGNSKVNSKNNYLHNSIRKLKQKMFSWSVIYDYNEIDRVLEPLEGGFIKRK